MESAQVPVDLLHWVLAILPIIAFLVPLKWRAPEAGPMAMFTAAIVALIAFRTPWKTLAVAGPKGVWDAILAGAASVPDHQTGRRLRCAAARHRQIQSQ